MPKTPEEAKQSARHALTVGIMASGFYNLLTARNTLLDALADIDEVGDEEAVKLTKQLRSLLVQVEEDIAQARATITIAPGDDPEVSHRAGATI